MSASSCLWLPLPPCKGKKIDWGQDSSLCSSAFPMWLARVWDKLAEHSCSASSSCPVVRKCHCTKEQTELGFLVHFLFQLGTLEVWQHPEQKNQERQRHSSAPNTWTRNKNKQLKLPIFFFQMKLEVIFFKVNLSHYIWCFNVWQIL